MEGPWSTTDNILDPNQRDAKFLLLQFVGEETGDQTMFKRKTSDFSAVDDNPLECPTHAITWAASEPRQGFHAHFGLTKLRQFFSQSSSSPPGSELEQSRTSSLLLGVVARTRTHVWYFLTGFRWSDGPEGSACLGRGGGCLLILKLFATRESNMCMGSLCSGVGRQVTGTFV